MPSRSLFTVLAALSVAACQQGNEASRETIRKGTPAYRQDVERICGVMSLSGADQLPEGERVFTTAQWLGNNLETEEGRDFLVTFQQSDDKAATLLAEARAVGLPDCALAAEWR